MKSKAVSINQKAQPVLAPALLVVFGVLFLTLAFLIDNQIIWSPWMRELPSFTLDALAETGGALSVLGFLILFIMFHEMKMGKRRRRRA